jgi:hypothetical protein
MVATAVMTQVARKFVAVVGPERNPPIAETIRQHCKEKFMRSHFPE